MYCWETRSPTTLTYAVKLHHNKTMIPGQL